MFDELPVDDLRKLGFNIQPMKVASALSKGHAEVPADEGIRTTLRLGDSALFVGEVRSTEAKALYEAKKLDWDEFIDYFKRTDNAALHQRTGYILEMMKDKMY